MIKALVRAFAIGANRAAADSVEVILGEQRFRLPEQSAADSLLSRASVASTLRLALARPARPRLEFAPALESEDEQELGARSTQLMSRWLENADYAQLEEALRLLAERRRRVPLALLPSLLVALDAPNRRSWLLPVAGKGTRWLARQNPEWRWALGDSSDPVQDFETGSDASRVAALARMRERDPEAARGALAAGFNQNDADARASLLGALATSLSSADEEFLERTLDDRAKSVRLVAAELLSRLPESALAQRAKARALALLQVERGLLRKSLKVELPPSPDKAEERDGVDGKGGIAGLHSAGSRQLQLAQRISQVPVSALAAGLSLSVGELVEWARGHEFSLPLLAGLCLSANRHAEPDALRALAGLAGNNATNALYMQWILPLLPTLPDFAELVLGRLRGGDIDLALLDRLPAPWPDAVAATVLQWARNPARRASLAAPYNYGEYVTLLQLAALRLQPREAYLRDWPNLGGPEASGSQQRGAEAVDEFIHILRSRLEFLNSLELP